MGSAASSPEEEAPSCTMLMNGVHLCAEEGKFETQPLGQFIGSMSSCALPADVAEEKGAKCPNLCLDTREAASMALGLMGGRDVALPANYLCVEGEKAKQYAAFFEQLDAIRPSDGAVMKPLVVGDGFGAVMKPLDVGGGFGDFSDFTPFPKVEDQCIAKLAEKCGGAEYSDVSKLAANACTGVKTRTRHKDEPVTNDFQINRVNIVHDGTECVHVYRG